MLCSFRKTCLTHDTVALFRSSGLLTLALHVTQEQRRYIRSRAPIKSSRIRDKPDSTTKSSGEDTRQALNLESIGEVANKLSLSEKAALTDLLANGHTKGAQDDLQLRSIQEWVKQSSNTSRGEASDIDTLTTYVMLLNDIEQTLSGTINPRKFNKDLWLNVKSLSKELKYSENEPPVELLVRLFELAKLQNEKRRRDCIKLVGDIIYSFEGLRLDMFNEAEYMDSLAFRGNYFRVIELWKSRSKKQDLGGSIFWQDIGIQYYQLARNYSKAEELSYKMEQTFQYVSPKAVMGFIRGYVGTEHSLLDKWFNVFCRKIENEGIIKNDESDTIDLDEQSARELLDKRRHVTREQIEDMLKLLINNKHWDLGAKLVEVSKKCNVELSVKSVLDVLDATTRKIAGSETLAYGPSKRGHRLGVVDAKDKQITVLISKVISTHPEVLEHEKFYESWLRGLAGLGQHDTALLVLEAMLTKGIKPTYNQCHTLLKALLARGKEDAALDMLSRMEADNKSFESAPNASIYALFVQYWARKSMHLKVDEVVERMRIHNVPHNEASFNTLLYYFYRHKQFEKAFLLYKAASISESIQFSQVNYRSLWTILRDFYRYPKAEQESMINSSSEIDCRYFFADMVKSPRFKPSYVIYELCLQTFILQEDFVCAGAVMCYIQNVNNAKIPVSTALGLIQLTQKLATGSKYTFPKVSKSDILIKETSKNELLKTSLDWKDVMSQICVISNQDKSLIEVGKDLCTEKFEDACNQNLVHT